MKNQNGAFLVAYSYASAVVALISVVSHYGLKY